MPDSAQILCALPFGPSRPPPHSHVFLEYCVGLLPDSYMVPTWVGAHTTTVFPGLGGQQQGREAPFSDIHGLLASALVLRFGVRHRSVGQEGTPWAAIFVEPLALVYSSAGWVVWSKTKARRMPYCEAIRCCCDFGRLGPPLQSSVSGSRDFRLMVCVFSND